MELSQNNTHFNVMVMNAKEIKIVQDRVLWNLYNTLYLFLKGQVFKKKIFHSQTDAFLTSLRAFAGPGEQPDCRRSEISPHY